MLCTYLSVEHIFTTSPLDRIFDALQAKRVNPAYRVRHVLVDIQPTSIPDRILANKPPHLRIVIPIPVVMQPSLMVMVLPLEPDGGNY
ncbi:hypothetical protein M495_24750 [Serratia liquefaciens ATCC 27592]|nr:hypothetical protein M495_24750 [Serratia liquefaciens ATCC 27592]